MGSQKALGLNDLITKFKGQRKMIMKLDAANQLNIKDNQSIKNVYRKIMSNVKNISPKLHVDFNLVTKKIDQGTQRILFTSKDETKNKRYRMSHLFLITKDGELRKYSVYFDSKDNPHSFLRDASPYDLLNEDRNIIKALTKLVNKN